MEKKFEIISEGNLNTIRGGEQGGGVIGGIIIVARPYTKFDPNDPNQHLPIACDKLA